MIFAPKDDLKFSKSFYTIDIETYTLAATQKNLWFGCIYGLNYKATFYSKDQFLKIIDQKRFKKSIIFAHNGGGFDFLVLFGNLIEKGAIYVGSRFIYMEYQDVIFADSMNFFKTSVKKIGHLIGIEKMELSDIGKIERNQQVTEQDIEYCINDCRIIFKALQSIFHGNRPCLTIGSLSLQIFQRQYLKNALKFNENVEKMYIDCYYGGRTEAFKLGAMNLEVYDINSMYPYAMKNVILPHPSFSFVRESPDLQWSKNYIREKEGMIHCKVIIPKSLKYMPLPYFDKKLIFPSGTITGKWCINEIRYAISLGCELIEVYTIVGSSRMITGKQLFGEFIDDNYKKKESSTGIQREFYKLILNNLYGKFGQHNFESVTYFETKEKAIEFLLKQKDYFRYEIKQFNKKRNDCTINVLNDKLTNHSIISIAAYITSFSRIMLHEYLMKFNPVYCDTDSLFIPIDQFPKPDTSSELGKLKLENYLITHIAGCKSYTKIENQETITKIKGIPKNAKKIGENHYLYKNIVKPKTSLRRNIELGSLIENKRKVSNKYTKGRVVMGNVTPFNIKNDVIQNPNFAPIKYKNRSLSYKIIHENPIDIYHLAILFFYSGGKIGKKQFKHLTGHQDVNKNYLKPSKAFDSLMELIENSENLYILDQYRDDLNAFGLIFCEIAMQYPTKKDLFIKLKEYYLKINPIKEKNKELNYINLAPF